MAAAAVDADCGHRFGYSFSLKPFQVRIIEATLQGHDTFVLAATGGGKSMCYILPPLLGGFLCVVISPLISLMQNQVAALASKNIKACFLGSETSTEEVTKQILAGELSLLYMTAEKLQGCWMDRLARIQTKRRIGLIAVDEAHCISEWGHDFRPEYREIGLIRERLPGVPVMCLTATATRRVRVDIISSLLRNPVQEIGSFHRPNLTIQIDHKTSSGSRKRTSITCAEQDAQRIFKLCNAASSDQLAIIYCNTRKDTEKMAGFLNQCFRKQSLPQRAVGYHAGLDSKLRNAIHDAFVANQIQLLVATLSFGMGIDKTNIRHVVHYGAPKSLETYYQQIGRAGRDGLPAACTMLWNKQDFIIQKLLMDDSEMNVSLLAAMRSFLEDDTKCRHALLLAYFGETVAARLPALAKCCDNCSLRRGQTTLLLTQATL